MTLLSSGGSRNFNTDAIIARYDQRISMIILADFILLGHEKVGSFALGASKIDLFTSAIQQIADSIADTFNSHAIPRLMKLNGMDTARAPKIKAGEITHVDLGVLGDFISKMAAAGAMQPDLAMDNYLRGLANLPKRSEEEGVPPMGMGAMPVPGAPQDPNAAPAPVEQPAETNLFDQMGGNDAEMLGDNSDDAKE